MVASTLAEERFYLQLEEVAAFITYRMEVIDSLEFKYSAIPPITELDLMDKTIPLMLEMMDNSSTHSGFDNINVPVLQGATTVQATQNNSNN